MKNGGHVTHTCYREDREKIRRWLIRSLLKASGIWGSGLDTLLTALRASIQTHGTERFPVDEMSLVMAPRGKSLNFEAAEIDDLLSLPYGDRRVFPLLALLFSFVDLRNQFHVDHVFPISRFTRTKLVRSGIPESDAEELQALANSVANLQLLEGAANIEKQAALPGQWLMQRYADAAGRENYVALHLLGEIPDEISEFKGFHTTRRERMRTTLMTILSEAG